MVLSDMMRCVIAIEVLWSLQFLEKQTQGGFQSFDIIDKGD